MLQDFLFEHGDYGPFVADYGYLDLSAITWTLEAIPATDFHTMPTGESEAGLIEHFAQHPVYWASVKVPEVGQHWEDHGTLLRPPLLIDRRLLDPADSETAGPGGPHARRSAARSPSRATACCSRPPGVGGASVRSCLVSLRRCEHRGVFEGELRMTEKACVPRARRDLAMHNDW
ncbi:hypothetical protein ACWD4K_32530 [Streptomyces gelaticus]